MDWRRLALTGIVALAGLKAAAATPPREGKVTIVADPIRCLELNASGTIVYNHCASFVRFGWRNRSNCADGCETEVSPAGFAMVNGLNGQFFYGACRDDQALRWLGWKYSCYPKPR